MVVLFALDDCSIDDVVLSYGTRRMTIHELASHLDSDAAEVTPAPRTESGRSRPSFGRRLLHQLAAHKWTLSAFLILTLLINLGGLGAPLATQFILDRVVARENLSLLAVVAIVMVFLMAFQIALTISRRLLLVRMSIQLDRVLLGEFCAHLLSLPTSFFRPRRVGDLVARFNDSGQVRGLVTGSLTRSAIDSLMVLVYLAVMSTYSVRLTFLVAAVLALFTVYMILISPLVKHLHRRLLQDKATHEADLIEMLSGIELVKSMAVERAVHRKWVASFERYLASSYETQKLRQILECAGNAIKFLCTAGLLWYGAVLVVGGQLSTGQLVALSMLASESLLPIVRLLAVWEEFQEARVALERVEEVRAELADFQLPAEQRLDPGRIEGRICFEAVSFDYKGESAAPVLRGLTFTIRPGERIALVGRSGSGKTTISRLLLGLLRPTRGQILIDGWDLRDVDLESFRRQVGVVLQDNLLVRGTVWENISLGDDQPDRKRIIEVARQAGADEFIEAMPQGYDSIIGEMGLSLSGGQRQRLSIARALYRDPRLLILDEATSALDSLSESAIHKNLGRILASRTALIIAHNFRTIRHADRILVLQDGTIAEEGTHDQLLARKGAYFRLVAGNLEA
jgi:ATP-binding cassette subfamily B protein